MKKLFSSLIIGSLISIMVPFQAFAQSDVSAADIIREYTQLLMTLNPSELNGTLKDYYLMGTELMAAQILFRSFSYDIDINENIIEPETEEAVKNFLLNHLKSTPVSIGLLSLRENNEGYHFAEIFIAFEMDRDDYENEIETPYLKAASSIDEMKEKAGTVIYTPYEIDGAVSYIDGLVFITEKAGTMERILDEYNCTENCLPALSDNADFSSVENKFYSDSAFEIYLNGQSDIFREYPFNEPGITTIYTMMPGMGFSVKETDSGYKMQSYAIFDEEKLNENGIDFTKEGGLQLHKDMPNLKPILYIASLALNDSFQILKIMPDYEMGIQELSDEAGFNVEEFLTIFENEIALLVQDSGEIFPTFTAILDLNDDSETGKEFVDAFTEGFWQKLAEEASASALADTITFEDDEIITTIKKEVTSENGSSYTQFHFNFTLKNSKNPYALKLPENLFGFTLTIGISADNLLMFSTNEDVLSSELGLQDIPEIDNLISDDTHAVMYMDINALADYIDDSLSDLEKIMPDELSDLSEIKNIFNLIFEPWDLITSTGTTTNSFSESEIEIKMDLELLIENYKELMEILDTGDLAIFEKLENMNKDFEDVNTAEWYGDNIYYLTSEGIIDGYPDGTFKPGNNINRAEFIALIIRTLEEYGYIENTCPYYCTLSDQFSDVEDYGWYTSYIKTAIDNDLVGGYADGTFRPNADITRAEAAQIFANIIDRYALTVPEPRAVNTDKSRIFNDVSARDWFVDAVASVYINNIMEGTGNGNFEGDRPINRAESAKIIRALIMMLDSGL